jgi:hypothetical protein
MRKISNAIMILMAAIVLIPACKCGGGGFVPATGTAKVKPYDDINRNGTYCLYKVTALPSSGTVQLKVGDIICIFCANQTKCDNYSKVEMEDGTTYDVAAQTNGLACTDCPKGTDTPPGYPFQKR